ncbi:MAG: XisI protein [Spirulina sp. SIO3F2]|nr:XisI protein [Spirulina sp. SIO3F2]
MEQLDFSGLIKQTLLRYLERIGTDANVEAQAVFDDEHGRYSILNVGWQDEERIFGCPIYVEVREDKIWIQRDFTEPGIATQLLGLGVDEAQIVLGYRSLTIRRLIAEMKV